MADASSDGLTQTRCCCWGRLAEQLSVLADKELQAQPAGVPLPGPSKGATYILAGGFIGECFVRRQPFELMDLS